MRHGPVHHRGAGGAHRRRPGEPGRVRSRLLVILAVVFAAFTLSSSPSELEE